MAQSRRLGLALGGGGARGLAHVGVIQVLAQAGVEVGAVSGTSIGAVAGAGLAMGLGPQEMMRIFDRFLHSELYRTANLDRIKALTAKAEEDSLASRIGIFIRRSLIQGKIVTSGGLIEPRLFARIIDFLIPAADFSQTRIPFVCAALNLTTGRPRLFGEGPLRPAVRASTAVPGAVWPVEIDGQLYCDGGTVMMAPVRPLKAMGAEVVVAVDISREMERDWGCGGALDVVIRTADAAASELNRRQLAEAYLIIKPKVGAFHWTDFEAGKEIFDIGRQAAQARLAEIKELIRRRWWRGFSLRPVRG